LLDNSGSAKETTPALKRKTEGGAERFSSGFRTIAKSLSLGTGAAHCVAFAEKPAWKSDEIQLRKAGSF
jgi:hypothetical protein